MNDLGFTCLLAGPGRGDCLHFVGLPGKSIPGEHDGPDDTVDVYGKPNGWCWSCWRGYQIMQLRHDIQAYRAALGYSVPANHDGKLSDGTTPQCGICNSEYRKNLETHIGLLRAACQRAFDWCTGKGEYADKRADLTALAEEVAPMLADALKETK